MPHTQSDGQQSPKERAIAVAGGLSRLAEHLGITRSAVSQWPQIPAERVHDVERITGIPRSELRPDLYPPERERLSA